MGYMNDSFTLNVRTLGINGHYHQEENYEDDSGFDLYVPKKTNCKPHGVTFIHHSIECEMIKSELNKFINRFIYSNVPFMLVPRSSISKTPLIMANSIGIIDKGYRGEIIGAVYNTSEDNYIVEEGTRLFQIILPSLDTFDVKFVDHLSESERGKGGFGSTDK